MKKIRFFLEVLMISVLALGSEGCCVRLTAGIARMKQGSYPRSQICPISADREWIRP